MLAVGLLTARVAQNFYLPNDSDLNTTAMFRVSLETCLATGCSKNWSSAFDAVVSPWKSELRWSGLSQVKRHRDASRGSRHRSERKQPSPRTGQLIFCHVANRLDDRRVIFRELVFVSVFGVDQFVADLNVVNAAASFNQFSLDSKSTLNFLCQTGSSRKVVSLAAVFDRDLHDSLWVRN